MSVIKTEDLIYPLFVKEGIQKPEEVPSMPGVFRHSIVSLIEEAREAKDKGIDKFLIFGIPKEKDEKASSATRENNIVAQAVKAIKIELGDITVFTDVCLCAYVSHGHCGVIKKGKEDLDKELTLKALAEMALTHAEAGADYIAPSAMAKEQVRFIREKLDSEGYEKVKIMGYSAKFASNAYGPFRDVAFSSPAFGDRTKYQLDFKDKKKALREIKDDIEEGADIVMVKPALWYLDIVKEAKEVFDHPLAVYNVSGEYSMIKKGAEENLWDEKSMVLEVLTSLKRAGADFIISYHAKDVGKWLL